MPSQAPAAQLQIGRSPSHALVLGVLGLLQTGVLLALYRQAAAGWLWAGLSLLALGLGWMGLRAWWSSGEGLLQWDGSAWRWSLWPRETICTVQWTVAIPGMSVLRLTSDTGAVRWLLTGPALEREPAWPAIRRALVAQGQRGRSGGGPRVPAKH